MLTRSIVAAALSVGAVHASPVLNKRQGTATVSVTSTEMTMSSTMASMAATEAMSSMASMESSSMMTSMMPVSASTPGATPTATSTDIAGQMFPLYPCPAGSELVYAQANMTVPMPIDMLTMTAGEWATSPIFPNVTESTGGSEVGATHTWNVMGIPYVETLVNATGTDTGSSFVQWVYNSTVPVTVMNMTTMMNTTIESYQTVFKAYDPTFSSLMMRGNTTVIQLFTNACSSTRDAAQMQLMMVHEMQLGLLASNSTGSGQVMTSTLATSVETATNTNTAVASTTVGATSIQSLTQTDTVVPATAVSTDTAQVTTTAATSTATTTDQTAFTTAATQTVTDSQPATTVQTTVATTTAA